MCCQEYLSSARGRFDAPKEVTAVLGQVPDILKSSQALLQSSSKMADICWAYWFTMCPSGLKRQALVQTNLTSLANCSTSPYFFPLRLF